MPLPTCAQAWTPTPSTSPGPLAPWPVSPLIACHAPFATLAGVLIILCCVGTFYTRCSNILHQVFEHSISGVLRIMRVKARSETFDALILQAASANVAWKCRQKAAAQGSDSNRAAEYATCDQRAADVFRNSGGDEADVAVAGVSAVIRYDTSITRTQVLHCITASYANRYS